MDARKPKQNTEHLIRLASELERAAHALDQATLAAERAQGIVGYLPTCYWITENVRKTCRDAADGFKAKASELRQKAGRPR